MKNPQEPSIIGHTTVLSYLENALKNGKIGQAVLILGPAHIGKKKIVNWLIKHENCQSDQKPCGTCQGCQTTRGNADPDLFWISDEQNAISVEEIRGLRSHVQKSPLTGSYVWAVIPDAERLSEEASNALLKELEEPKPAARFILTASHPDQLLPTIRSRCSQIHCQLIPQNAIYEALVTVGVDRSKALAVSRFSQGRPGIAIRFLKDAAYQKQILQTSRSFLKLLPTVTPARAAVFSDALQAGDIEPEVLIEALQFTLRECLMYKIGNAQSLSTLLPEDQLQTATETSVEIWTKRLNALQTAQSDRQTPSKDQYIFERFFTTL